MATTIKNMHSTQTLCRFLSTLDVNTHPSKPGGSHVANGAASNPCGGLNPPDNARVSIVSVELLPGATELGEITHVGRGAGPVTEQASAMLPENPP